jgi:hypothetical protein
MTVEDIELLFLPGIQAHQYTTPMVGDPNVLYHSVRGLSEACESDVG